MAFTDMMSSGRGPGVIGMVMALFVLLGFGLLFLFATDEGAQGGALSIEAQINRQTKEIDTLHRNIERDKQVLATKPGLLKNERSLASLQRKNQSREVELDGLRKGVETANSRISELVEEFEAYKNEYRKFIRSEAKGEKLDEITTLDGKHYQNVTVRKVTAVGMQIAHQGGFTRIPFENLPEDLQDHYQFDPKQKDEAMALEKKRRIEHEKAVARTNAQLAMQQKAARKERQNAELAEKRRRVALLREQIRNLDEDIKQMQKAIPLEANKSISRAPQMRLKLSSMQKKQDSMRRELSRLSAEL